MQMKKKQIVNRLNALKELKFDTGVGDVVLQATLVEVSNLIAIGELEKANKALLKGESLIKHLYKPNLNKGGV